jgi:hypothetical protein
MAAGSAFQRRFSQGVVASVLGCLLWTIILTVAPELHELVHPDAGHDDHDCAVVLMAHGGFEHSIVAAPSVAPAERAPIFHLAIATAPFVVSLAVSTATPERGPPCA